MGSKKKNAMLLKYIVPLIGTGGLGAILIAFLNYGGGHNFSAGNVSGTVAIGDHPTIQINNFSSVSNLSNELPSSIGQTNLVDLTDSAGLTPLQIVNEVRSARPAARELQEKSFNGALVDWTLCLADITSDEKNTIFSIVMLNETDNLDVVPVSVWVKKTQLAELTLLTNGTRVRVRGEIFDVDTIGVRVHKATLTPSQ
jgi:hypothetical protein